MLVFFTANDARSASRSEFFFEYKEGMICLNGKRIPILPLLEKIIEASSIEIFVIDGIDSRSITADFKDRPLEDALKSILKDCNYAIVYCEDKSSTGKIHILKMSTFSAGKNNIHAQAAGKTYRSKKRKRSEKRTNQVMDPETEREIDAFMREADSHTPEQINMAMEEFKKEGTSRESSVENRKALNSAINSPNSHSRQSAAPGRAGAKGNPVFSSDHHLRSYSKGRYGFPLPPGER